VSGVVDTDSTGLVDVSELAPADSLDDVTTELEGVSVGVGEGVGVGVGVGVGEGVGVGVGDVDGFVVGIAVAFALASKRGSMIAFRVPTSSGWAIETTIFPVGSTMYTFGLPFVLYKFVMSPPPVKTGHVIPVWLIYVELIVSAEAPVVSTLRN